MYKRRNHISRSLRSRTVGWGLRREAAFTRSPGMPEPFNIGSKTSVVTSSEYQESSRQDMTKQRELSRLPNSCHRKGSCSVALLIPSTLTILIPTTILQKILQISVLDPKRNRNLLTEKKFIYNSTGILLEMRDDASKVIKINVQERIWEST